MPFLLLLVTAIIQFGIMLSDYSTVVNAARAGRARARPRGPAHERPLRPGGQRRRSRAPGEFTIPSGDITPSLPSSTGGTTTEDYCGSSSPGSAAPTCTTELQYERRRGRGRPGRDHHHLPLHAQGLRHGTVTRQSVDGVHRTRSNETSDSTSQAILGASAVRRCRLVVLSLVVLIGFAGLAIDLARVWVAQQELQRAVDAPTLAAGQDLPDSGHRLHRCAGLLGYGQHGNAVGGWGVNRRRSECDLRVRIRTGRTTHRDTHADLPDGHQWRRAATRPPRRTNRGSAYAADATTCNAVTITETATVSTPACSAYSYRNFTVTASSTAASREVRGCPNR